MEVAPTCEHLLGSKVGAFSFLNRFASRRKVYVQEQKGVDPNLDLRELRQHMLDIRRMRTSAVCYLYTVYSIQL